MIKTASNHIETFLIENNKTFSWLSDQTGIKRTTLIYKVRNRCNLEILHALSYFEYTKIENLITDYDNAL